MGSYRPISLLNTDFKLLSRIKANRLQSFLPEVLTKSQTGFVDGRSMTYNIRTALGGIIFSHRHKLKNNIIIGIDADKACDRISWSHLIRILKFRYFGPIFFNFMRSIYYRPQTTVCINGIQSPPFHRGTRQGCPL